MLLAEKGKRLSLVLSCLLVELFPSAVSAFSIHSIQCHCHHHHCHDIEFRSWSGKRGRTGGASGHALVMRTSGLLMVEMGTGGAQRQMMRQQMETMLIYDLDDSGLVKVKGGNLAIGGAEKFHHVIF